MKALVEQLLVHVLRSYAQPRRSDELELSRVGLVDRRIRRSVELMHTQLDQDLTLKALAAASYPISVSFRPAVQKTHWGNAAQLSRRHYAPRARNSCLPTRNCPLQRSALASVISAPVTLPKPFASRRAPRHANFAKHSSPPQQTSAINAQDPSLTFGSPLVSSRKSVVATRLVAEVDEVPGVARRANFYRRFASKTVWALHATSFRRRCTSKTLEEKRECLLPSKWR